MSKPVSFNEHYRTLKRIAEELQQQHDEPDIDGLVPKVEQALHAYEQCRQRLDAVQALLDERLATQDDDS